MEILKLETIENIISVEKTTIEAFEKNGEIATLDKCILMGMEELKQYRIAKEQGLLLRLPCKVGDVVYILTPKKNDYIETNIKRIVVYDNDIEIVTCICVRNIKEIGKTVFLTKEEAVQALERMEVENG